MKKLFYGIAAASILCSCAGSFKSVNPSAVSYYTPADRSDVDMQYKYDVLREKGNKKYARKELKAGFRLVAVKITNTTGKPIKMGEDAKIYSGDSEIRLWPPDLIFRKIKQTTPLYLLYLLLTPTTLTTGSETFPIGYILGPGLAAGNIAVAATANKRLKEELMQFDISEKRIGPGETAYGLIGVPEMGFVPLRVVIKH